MIKTLLTLFFGMTIFAFSMGQIGEKDIRITSTYYTGTDILKIRFEYYYDHWSEQKIKQGKYSEWDKKGNLLFDAFYKENKLDGEMTYYFPSGNPKRVIPYKKDIIEGIVKNYYSNGKLKKQILYQNGLKDGLMKTYDKNGELKSEVRFTKGKK